MIRIARELQIEVVAEGVETREYVDFLKEQKCDWFRATILENQCQPKNLRS